MIASAQNSTKAIQSSGWCSMTTSSSLATIKWTSSSGDDCFTSFIRCHPAVLISNASGDMLAANSSQRKRKTMAKIERVEILQVDLAPKAVRTDAIQSFATQE